MARVTSGALRLTQCTGGPPGYPNRTKTTGYNMNVPVTPNSDYSGTPIPTVTLSAPMFEIVWKSSDRKQPVAATVTENRTIPARTSSPGSVGLSTGDQAAIGVGVVAALTLVVAALLGWYFFRQRRRARVGEEQPLTESDRARDLGAVPKERQGLPAVTEMSGTALNELPGPSSELPGTNKSVRRT